MSEESSLSKIYNSMPESMRTGDDADVRHLVQIWKQENSPKAMEILVNSFIPLCIHHALTISRKYKLEKNAYDELEADLMLALPKIIEKFDPERDNLAHTYIDKSLRGHGQIFIKDYLGLRSQKQRYIFYHYGELRDHVLKDHSTPEHPVSTAKLHEEMAMLADAIKPKKYITTPIKANDITEISLLRHKLFNGQIKERVQNAHLLGQAFHEIDKSGEYNPDLIVKNTDQNLDLHSEYSSNPEENNIAYEEQIMVEAFMYRAGMALESEDPIGWYIVKKHILEESPTDKATLARELNLTIGQIYKKLNHALNKLKILYGRDEVMTPPPVMQPQKAKNYKYVSLEDFVPITLPVETITPQEINEPQAVEAQPIEIENDLLLIEEPPTSSKIEPAKTPPEPPKYLAQDMLNTMLNYRNQHDGEWPTRMSVGRPNDGTILGNIPWTELGFMDFEGKNMNTLRLEYEASFTAADVEYSVEYHKKRNSGEKPTKTMPQTINDYSKLHGYKWGAVDRMKIEDLSLAQHIKRIEERQNNQDCDTPPALEI